MELLLSADFLGEPIELRVTFHEDTHNDYEPPYIVLDDLATLVTDPYGNEFTVDLGGLLDNPDIYKAVIEMAEEERV